MTKEQAYLLNLISSKLTGKPCAPCQDTICCNALAREAEQQAVSLFLMDVVPTCPQDCEKMQQCVVRAIASNTKISYAQSRLTKLLESNDIPYAVLKGESVAAYYTQPQLRILGDVDFLIEEDMRDTVEKLLLNNGYVSLSIPSAHHSIFRKYGAYFEMHWQAPGIPEGKIGQTVRRFLKGSLQERVLQAGEYGPFYTLTKERQGLVLLLHMQQHLLHEGIGLRHLCDWAFYVNATRQDAFWQESLLPRLKEMGLLTFACVLTKTSAIYLELNCPQWAAADEELCKRLLEDILQGGNFGTKDKLRQQGAMLIHSGSESEKPKGLAGRLLAKLHAVVKEKYPIVQRLPILYPVFWVYRVVRRVVLQMFGKRPPIRELAPVADARNEIYRQLRIFQKRR